MDKTISGTENAYAFRGAGLPNENLYALVKEFENAVTSKGDAVTSAYIVNMWHQVSWECTSPLTKREIMVSKALSAALILGTLGVGKVFGQSIANLSGAAAIGAVLVGGAALVGGALLGLRAIDKQAHPALHTSQFVKKAKDETVQYLDPKAPGSKEVADGVRQIVREHIAHPKVESTACV